jgi:hypothetical protein
LAKEVLESAMLAAMKMAEFYTPTLAMPNRRENANGRDAEFLHWLKLAVECASKLAPYQSPTLRAIYLKTNQHGKALAKPKTVEDVLAEVEQRSGVEGRRAFEDFMRKMDRIESREERAEIDAKN